MLKHILYKFILKNFFKIDLTSVERDVAVESVELKYYKATRDALIYGILAIPSLLFMDYAVLASVLIPTTMVSGTAWFAVSMSNVKKKFEKFGLELTVDMFRSFVTSLVILGLLVLVSLNPKIFSGLTQWGVNRFAVVLISGLLGTAVVFKLIYDIYLGALKYDINDTMFAGQTEAAEKYYKKSLSLLNSCAENLRLGKGPEVANYHIGLAFYEIFTYIITTKGADDEFHLLLKDAENLKSNPMISRDRSEKISTHLIEKFLMYSTNIADEKTRKSYRNIQLELNCIRSNKNELQAIRDTRLSVIFEEMACMLENQGESLFKKRTEIEKKFLVKNAPNLLINTLMKISFKAILRSIKKKRYASARKGSVSFGLIRKNLNPDTEKKWKNSSQKKNSMTYGLRLRAIESKRPAIKFPIRIGRLNWTFLLENTKAWCSLKSSFKMKRTLLVFKLLLGLAKTSLQIRTIKTRI